MEMRTSIQVRTSSLQRVFEPVLLLVVFLGILTSSQPASGQANFKPLERGNYTEVEEKLIMLRGLEVSGAYGFRIRVNSTSELGLNQGTDAHQDLRLNMKTVFHRDVAIHLNLEMGKGNFAESNLRENSSVKQGDLQDGQTLAIMAREAYLRYKFNPRSALLVGKQEVSVGDNRGMIFSGIVPAITLECNLGTWCMPFEMAKVGPTSGDVLYHIGFRYTAWNHTEKNVPKKLEVEIYRINYKEGNIPLGRNLGPARFNPDDPINAAGKADASQYLENSIGKAPIYFDASGQNFYGINISWRKGAYFTEFNYLGNKGWRKYHTYRYPFYGVIANLDSPAQGQVIQLVKGTALEAEIGLDTPDVRYGLRVLNGSGDQYVPGAGSNQTFDRGLRGYFEITPGTYRGTRLYFNGAGSQLDQGAGLGHSINNTRMVGMFLDVNKKTKKTLEYSFGLYKLDLNEPILNTQGVYQSDIGLEMDNLLIWNQHKALKFHFELNAIKAGGAFRADDYSRPSAKPNDMIQAIFRLLYTF